MAYTKFGPFTNGSASPPINSQFLNAVESTLVSTETTANNAAAQAAANAGGFPRYTIAQNTDWNTLTAYGWYLANTHGQTWAQYGQTNNPPAANSYGLLEVAAQGNSIVQRYTEGITGLWTRQQFDGGWSAWNHLLPETVNAVNAITGWYHVDNYGATGNGSTDDSNAIQAAVDAANAAYNATGAMQRVYFSSKKYLVAEHPFYQSGGNQDGAASIYLKDGVELFGSALITVANNTHGNGSYYAIVRTRYEGATNVAIRGLRFDGNRANNPTSQNTGNILIEAADNVAIENVDSVNSPGNGIMVRGNAYGSQATSIKIKNCYVYGVTGIGIQASQFDGCQIMGNNVINTSDNGIDVYGEYGNVTTSSHGTNFQVNDNSVRASGNVGLFMETVAYGTVVGNRVSNCPTGIRVNRINGQPTSVGIRANSFFGCQVGAAFSGDQVDISVHSNEFQQCSTAGIQFDGYRSSGLFGHNNLITTTGNNVPLILSTSYVSQLSRIYLVQTMTDSSATVTYANYAQASAQVSIAGANGPGF